ncbi:MAG TPA: hypothetical protein VMR25_22700, partial [Planctomycetaceae bacterium]|nr:hypothetical protein [Planctomycetaceae bacterium]
MTSRTKLATIALVLIAAAFAIWGFWPTSTVDSKQPTGDPNKPEAIILDESGHGLHADSVRWQRINLDKTFRSEGVAAFDVNHDGKIDIVAGDVWYEAPNWKMHEIRTPG